jgi:hypothetical protein
MLRGQWLKVARCSPSWSSNTFNRGLQVEQAIEILRTSGDTNGEGAYITDLITAMENAKASITIPTRDDAKVRVPRGFRGSRL